MTNLNRLNLMFVSGYILLAFNKQPGDYRILDCTGSFAQTFGKNMFSTVSGKPAKYA